MNTTVATPPARLDAPAPKKQSLKEFFVVSADSHVNEPHDLWLKRIDAQFRGSGFSGCNTWSATMWPVRGQRFAVGPVALTKKTCAPQIMAFEKAYLAALHSAPTWDMVNGLLEVKSGAGTLSFARGF